MKTILKEGIAVNCKTEEEAKEFLAILDKDGYKWSKGEKLTNFTKWDRYKEKTCYSIYITFGYSDIDFHKSYNYNIISFAEFKKSLNSHRKAAIYHIIDGNKTIIKLSNGKVGIANCLPTDKFNEGVGAVIAVARAYNVDLKEIVKMIEKKKPTKIEYFTDENGRKYHVVKQDKYEVGDKVKIVDLKTFKKCLSRNLDGDMDKWTNKLMTIKFVGEINYRMNEDDFEFLGNWFWYDDMILGKVIYDEPELYYAKDIVGKWAKVKIAGWQDCERKIIFADNKKIVYLYREGNRLGYTEDKEAFGKTWQLI